MYETKDGYSGLSVAIDEIYLLRAMAAEQANLLEKLMAYKSFPIKHREAVADQILRLRAVARGIAGDPKKFDAIRPETFNCQILLESAGARGTLTNHQWALQLGLVWKGSQHASGGS